MTSISRPIVFFGTEQFSLFSLEALVSAGFPVCAVVTKPDSIQGRGHKLTPPPIKQYAIEHGITVWQPKKLHELTSELVALNNPIGVLVSYGKIIPQSTIDLFTPGIINVHPSLLPKYRGPSPIETAILNGDRQTGVSIMQLSAAMDAGPVYKQSNVTMNGDETAADLYESLGREGAEMLVSLLPSISNESLTPTPQNDETASYCQLIKKTDSIIKWDLPAVTTERHIRAYQTWPQSRTQLGDIDVIITKAHTTPGSAGVPGSLIITETSLSVATSDGLLVIDSLKPIGKKEMPVTAFLMGYKSKLEAS